MFRWLLLGYFLVGVLVPCELLPDGALPPTCALHSRRLMKILHCAYHTVCMRCYVYFLCYAMLSYAILCCPVLLLRMPCTNNITLPHCADCGGSPLQRGKACLVDASTLPIVTVLWQFSLYRAAIPPLNYTSNPFYPAHTIHIV